MARISSKNHTEEVSTPDGSLILPDAASFPKSSPMAAPDDPANRPGRALGIDYDEWAVATIDLTGRPDRIAATRLRYAQKGYQVVGGQPIVVGVPQAEVWVKPRARWLESKVHRRNTIANLVRQGVLSESALSQSVTTQG